MTLCVDLRVPLCEISLRFPVPSASQVEVEVSADLKNQLETRIGREDSRRKGTTEPMMHSTRIMKMAGKSVGTLHRISYRGLDMRKLVLAGILFNAGTAAASDLLPLESLLKRAQNVYVVDLSTRTSSNAEFEITRTLRGNEKRKSIILKHAYGSETFFGHDHDLLLFSQSDHTGPNPGDRFHLHQPPNDAQDYHGWILEEGPSGSAEKLLALRAAVNDAQFSVQGTGIVGLWQIDFDASDVFGEEPVPDEYPELLTFRFQADGSMQVKMLMGDLSEEMDGSYSIEGDVLTMTQSGETNGIVFSIEENEMTLKDEMGSFLLRRIE